MRLHRLTGLEQEKLTEEYKLLLDTIRGLSEILEDPDVLLEVIRTELRNVKEEFGDDRRSEIRASEEDLDILDLIAPEDVVVTLSHSGYAKRQPVSSYRAQKRGGRGRTAAATKDEAFIDQLDRKSVREGKSVSGSVDSGGARIIKKKKKTKKKK